MVLQIAGQIRSDDTFIAHLWRRAGGVKIKASDPAVLIARKNQSRGLI